MELKEGGGMSPGICKSWYFGGVQGKPQTKSPEIG